MVLRPSRLKRRYFLGLGLSTAVLASCGRTEQLPSSSATVGSSATSPVAGSTPITTSASKIAPQLRLGFQPPYVGVYVLQEQKLLEKALADQPTAFDAFRMLSLKPVTEAIAAGAIDLGMGGTPIAAIAAGLPIQVIALIERSPKTHAILVRPDSTITTVADLKGKKVGTPQGKSHLLVLRALEKANLKPIDIEWVQLENDVGRSALRQGAIDAWATWDPFYAGVETAKEAVPIIDGEGYINNYVVIFSRTDYLKQYPDTVIEFLKTYRQAVNWVNAQREAAANILVQQNKLSLEAARLTLSRRNFLVEPPNDNFREDVTEQGKLLLQLNLTNQEPNWDQVIDPTIAKIALS